jgi:hypothetical protein
MSRKTVRVRIPVAVDFLGRYVGYGWGDGNGGGPESHEEALDAFDYNTVGPNEMWFWLTAELPIPDIADVAAEVEAVP